MQCDHGDEAKYDVTSLNFNGVFGVFVVVGGGLSLASFITILEIICHYFFVSFVTYVYIRKIIIKN